MPVEGMGTSGSHVCWSERLRTDPKKKLAPGAELRRPNADAGAVTDLIFLVKGVDQGRAQRSPRQQICEGMADAEIRRPIGRVRDRHWGWRRRGAARCRRANRWRTACQTICRTRRPRAEPSCCDPAECNGWRWWSDHRDRTGTGLSTMSASHRLFQAPHWREGEIIHLVVEGDPPPYCLPLR